MLSLGHPGRSVTPISMSGGSELFNTLLSPVKWDPVITIISIIVARGAAVYLPTVQFWMLGKSLCSKTPI